MAQRTYYIDRNGSPRYSDTRRFVRRDLLPALTEVDPPDAPPAPAASSPAESAKPAAESRWMNDGLPPPELPWQPPAEPAADSIGDALRQAAEGAEAEPSAEPSGLRPLFEEAEAELEAESAPSFAGKHDEDCPYSVAAQRCGCGAEYLATTEAEGQVLAGVASRAVDTVIGRVLRRPIVPRAVMGDPRILEAVGISVDEWAMIEAAEAEAWRKMAAKYGSGIGPYAVEIGLAAALFTGATVRMQAGAVLAAGQAQAKPEPATVAGQAEAEAEEAAE